MGEVALSIGKASERRRIVDALRDEDWNISRAARRLGVLRQALQRDVRKMGGLLFVREQHGVADVAPVAPVAPQRGATGATTEVVEPATQSATVALRESKVVSIFANVNGNTETAADEMGDREFRTANVPLTYDEWLWLRRRGEQEALHGGDASIKGQIKSLIARARTEEGGDR
jgi:transposase-like protein